MEETLQLCHVGFSVLESGQLDSRYQEPPTDPTFLSGAVLASPGWCWYRLCFLKSACLWHRVYGCVALWPAKGDVRGGWCRCRDWPRAVRWEARGSVEGDSWHWPLVLKSAVLAVIKFFSKINQVKILMSTDVAVLISRRNRSQRCDNRSRKDLRRNRRSRGGAGIPAHTGSLSGLEAVGPTCSVSRLVEQTLQIDPLFSLCSLCMAVVFLRVSRGGGQ